MAKKLSIDFIPIEHLNNTTLNERVELIIKRIKDKKIIIINSMFNPEEEAVLIKKTMENINKSFPGIEICSLSTIDLNKDNRLITRIRESIINLLTGGKRGITVIGPAKIVKKIKREPDHISLLTK